MNNNILRSVVVTSLLTLSAFATGCAASTEDASVAETSNVASTQSTLSVGVTNKAEDFIKDLADATVESFGKKAFVFAWDSTPINANAFIHTDDDKTRKSLRDLAMENGRDVVAGVAGEMVDVMKWQAHAKGDKASLRALAANMDDARAYPALAALSKVNGRIRAAEAPESNEAMLSLEVAVTQLLVAKLTIQTQLDPTAARTTALSNVLSSHDYGAIAHVTYVTDALRTSALNERLADIGECGLLYYGKDLYGFVDMGTQEIPFQTTTADKQAAKRCNAFRQPYVVGVQNEAAKAIDTKHAFATGVVGAWTKLAHEVDPR